jgi:hypothetical protein
VARAAVQTQQRKIEAVQTDQGVVALRAELATSTEALVSPRQLVRGHPRIDAAFELPPSCLVSAPPNALCLLTVEPSLTVEGR